MPLRAVLQMRKPSRQAMRQEKPFGKRSHHGDPLISLSLIAESWVAGTWTHRYDTDEEKAALAEIDRAIRWGGHARKAKILNSILARGMLR